MPEAVEVKILQVNAAVARRKDAHRDGGFQPQPQRVADGDHGFADADLVAVAQLERGKVFAVNLNHGDVERRIASDHRSFHGLAVEERDRDLVGAVDHVVVGEDAPVLGDDEAAPGSLHGNAARVLAEHVAEEFPEEGIVGQPLIYRASDRAFDVDIDDCMTDLLDQIGDGTVGGQRFRRQRSGKSGQAARDHDAQHDAYKRSFQFSQFHKNSPPQRIGRDTTIPSQRCT